MGIYHQLVNALPTVAERQLVLAFLMACALVLSPGESVAQEFQYAWQGLQRDESSASLAAVGGAAEGQGITAIINVPMKTGGDEAVSVFDAKIDSDMDGLVIVSRVNDMRITTSFISMLVTSIEYEAPGGRKIVTFAGYQSVDKKTAPEDESIVMVRADGPGDRALMDRYTVDLLSMASDARRVIEKAFRNKQPDEAGNILEPNKDTSYDLQTMQQEMDSFIEGMEKLLGMTLQQLDAKQNTQVAPAEIKPVEPMQPLTADAQQNTNATQVSPPVPKDWRSNVYSEGVEYLPTLGPLVSGSNAGFLSILVFKPMALNGLPVRRFLSNFTKNREQYWDVTRQEPAIADGPNQAWDYLRVKNKNGLILNISFLAIRTGEDTVRIFREILTEDDADERYGYVRAIEQLYRFIEKEALAPYSSDTAPATMMQLMSKTLETESRAEQRKRTRAAQESARREHVGAVSSLPGEGIQAAQIVAVLLRSDFLERAYGGKDADVSVYVLLKDGTAYRNPTVAPSDVNVTASRQLESSHWLEWKEEGEQYSVRADASAPWQELRSKLAYPAPSTTFDFRGAHIAAWGDILSGTAGHRTGSIRFTQEGRYETSSFALMGGSGITGLPAATVSSSTGPEGRQSSSSSNVAPAFLNNTQRDPDGTDFTGQYALRHYTAEFLTDSGKLNRKLFLMTKDGGVYVGGRYYSAPDK